MRIFISSYTAWFNALIKTRGKKATSLLNTKLNNFFVEMLKAAILLDIKYISAII